MTAKPNECVCVRVYFFAKAKELVGLSEEKLVVDKEKLNDLTGIKLIKIIVDHYPRLEIMKDSIVLAINENYIDMDDKIRLNENDEVALIPPISGG